jgi:uncharacterized protein (DUF58 family)
MIAKEILKKVKRLEITTRGLVNDVFSGEYHSIFKGRGMDFSEVREYSYGDDIRNIDWNVTARMGHPYVKIFQEERELTVMLMVDLSSSANFGTYEQLKGEVAAEICALLAFSAIKNNDKVGLIIFTDKIEKFIPPKKGRTHVLRVLRELLYHRPSGGKTDIAGAIEFLNRIAKRRSVVFLISDFISEGYERDLRIANKKHDVIAITITDKREIELPDVGYIELEDAETGETYVLDTSSKRIRSSFFALSSNRREALLKNFKSMNIDYIDIFTDTPYVEPMMKFFRMRARRLRR